MQCKLVKLDYSSRREKIKKKTIMNNKQNKISFFF